ncbi:hypothetical protein [Halobacillus sp. BBL2006]|uniref:hypothetical protein n=1 Tax=Halobacillus sp. BBL2006 TaxID=1543706 RepID=UPI0005428013|nr:hypothetical protein [Halobacillus sp. BBL2006]KHE66693.1 hypothetical protein LD39_21435 [Halobacillus sp. BBL2006]
MKKWLLALGLTSALMVAGCSSDSAEEDTNGDSDNQTEETNTNDEQSNDEQATKKELLNAQMNLKDAFKDYQAKIAAYEAAVSEEEPDPEAIKTSGEEALTAAQEASEEASNYTVEADLSEDMKSQYQEAISSLQAYYEEVASALEGNVEEADLSTADEKFTEFNDKLGEMYKEAGLLAPNMKDELS